MLILPPNLTVPATATPSALFASAEPQSVDPPPSLFSSEPHSYDGGTLSSLLPPPYPTLLSRLESASHPCPCTELSSLKSPTDPLRANAADQTAVSIVMPSQQDVTRM